MPPTQQNLGFSQLRVGIFVLAGLIVFGFLVLNSTGDFNPFAKKIELRAHFATADGLRDGADVQLAGVSIGKVEEVRLLPIGSPQGQTIEAVMRVDEVLDGKPISQRIRTDSTAQLVATSVLANDKMINITPGSVEGEPVTSNDVLNSSAAISVNQLTQTGNDLLQQINKLAKPTNDILVKANSGEGTLGKFINDDRVYNDLDKTINEARKSMIKIQNSIDRINSGNGTAAKLLNDPALYNNLNSTIAQLDQIAIDIRNGKGSAGKLLTDDQLYNETTGAVTDLRSTIKEIKPTIQSMNAVTKNLETITKDLSEGKGSAGKLLTDDQLYNDTKSLIQRLNATSTRFESLLADTQSGKGTIGKLFTDDTLYNNINQTSSNINQLSSEGTKLMYDFRQDPKKYLSINLKLF